jgi:multimeric flavodoxin WrbA
MQAYLISDGEFESTRQAELKELLKDYFTVRGFSVLEKTLQRDELAFCRGCFDCWVKTPGECIMRDGIVKINQTCMTSDVVVYLCPVVFGQFSANMKYAIDRWLPNMLPYFTTRKDGSTMHTPRYTDYPAQIFLGYGAHLSEAEMQLFTDINLKHRSSVTVILDRGDDADICTSLGQSTLQRVGGAL